VEVVVSPTLAEVPSSRVTPVDFRRPSRIGRDAVVALANTHDGFARRLATTWSAGSYAAVEIEHVSTDQLSIDDFVRSLPQPTAVGIVRVGALGATAFVQVDLPLALLYIERLLGGPGDTIEAPVTRRPTDLENALLREEVLGPAIVAIDEALRELGGERSELLGLETTPQPLQLGSPGELLLLLTYKVEVRGEVTAQGLVTLAYPVAPLVTHLDRLVTGQDPTVEDASQRPPVLDALLDAPIDLHVRLSGSPMAAATVADLAVGDVLRLDHPVARPAELVVDGRTVGSAHLGRRGRRVAGQVIDPPTVPTP
jgi:flagellar motor switch protein FliM